MIGLTQVKVQPLVLTNEYVTHFKYETRMKFSFKAVIYKVSINPCVEVPERITDKMARTRGYIRIKGKIEDHAFHQTLVPVKDAGYRLYVNGLMIKGAGVSIGQHVKFEIENDFDLKSRDVPMPKVFKKLLEDSNVYGKFKTLIPSKQKEILRYLR